MVTALVVLMALVVIALLSAHGAAPNSKNQKKYRDYILCRLIMSASTKPSLASNELGHATKRIAVTKEVWESLPLLRRPGETFDALIGELIQTEKKARLMRDVLHIDEKEEFVELT